MKKLLESSPPKARLLPEKERPGFFVHQYFPAFSGRSHLIGSAW
ncbi:hypothetical protein [Hymenobacter negativus]|nr:hypothetical protein [Hymenobacter negativus]